MIPASAPNVSSTDLNAAASLNKQQQTGCSVEHASQKEIAPLSYPSPPQDDEIPASTVIHTSEPDLTVHDGDLAIAGERQPLRSRRDEELEENRVHWALTNGITFDSLNSINALQLPSAWTDAHERNIVQPFTYIASLPAKKLRTQTLAAFNVWLQIDPESCSVIDKVVGMLHNASLLIDDIQDASPLRRGSPAAHCIFGIPQTINAANYMYFLAQRELSNLRDSGDAFKIFNEELLNLHRGQGLDLYWRDTMTVPTEEEYYLMISQKTGGLFRLATRLMQSVSTTGLDVLPLAELVGLIFQIRDDYQNLCSEKMASTKGFCEDLTEGKFSLPVIHAIRNSPARNNELLNILRLRTPDPGLKAHALWTMRHQTKSLEYTRHVLRYLHSKALDASEAVGGGNEIVKKLLASLDIN